MKLLFIIFSLFISTYTLHAQTYKVSGSVQDADKTSMEGCSIWFLQADTLVGGCVTDKKGRFELKGLLGLVRRREASAVCAGRRPDAAG